MRPLQLRGPPQDIQAIYQDQSEADVRVSANAWRLRYRAFFWLGNRWPNERQRDEKKPKDLPKGFSLKKQLGDTEDRCLAQAKVHLSVPAVDAAKLYWLAEKLVESQVKKTRYRDAKPALAQNYGWICAYCETYTPTNLHVEHMLPKASFPWRLEQFANFVPACATCNSAKGNSPAWNSAAVPKDVYDTFLKSGRADVLTNVLPIETATRATRLWPNSDVAGVRASIAWVLTSPARAEQTPRQFLDDYFANRLFEDEGVFHDDFVWPTNYVPMMAPVELARMNQAPSDAAVARCYANYQDAQDPIDATALDRNTAMFGAIQRDGRKRVWLRHYLVQAARTGVEFWYADDQGNALDQRAFSTASTEAVPHQTDTSLTPEIRKKIGCRAGDRYDITRKGPTSAQVTVRTAFAISGTNVVYWHPIYPVLVQAQLPQGNFQAVARQMVDAMKLNEVKDSNKQGLVFTDRRAFWRTKAWFEAARTLKTYLALPDQERTRYCALAAKRAPYVGHWSIWDQMIQSGLSGVQRAPERRRLEELRTAIRDAFPGTAN